MNRERFVATNPMLSQFASDNEPDDYKNDDWNPSQETFDKFLVRDFALAQRNIQQVLANRGVPMPLREIKECSLHSIEVIERVLASKMASGLVREDKGRYSLVRK